MESKMSKQKIIITIVAAIDCDNWLSDKFKNETELINFLKPVVQKKINKIQNKNIQYKSFVDFDYSELI